MRRRGMEASRESPLALGIDKGSCIATLLCTMQIQLPRRDFLKQSALLSTTLALPTLSRSGRAASASPGEKILVGVMGVNGRGMAHIQNFLALPKVRSTTI